MVKFVSHYNYSTDDSHLESVDTSSCAVPSMSLSVREILERFRRGTIDPSELVNKSFYDDSDTDLDVPVNEITDLTDVSDVIGASNQKIRELKDKVKQKD